MKMEAKIFPLDKGKEIAENQEKSKREMEVIIEEGSSKTTGTVKKFGCSPAFMLVFFLLLVLYLELTRNRIDKKYPLPVFNFPKQY